MENNHGFNYPEKSHRKALRTFGLGALIVYISGMIYCFNTNRIPEMMAILCVTVGLSAVAVAVYRSFGSKN